MAFTYPLNETPATFPAGMLGERIVSNDGSKEYIFVKNTDASSLASGDCVTWELPESFTVDLCASTEIPCGLVVNDITGDVAAVNDGLWIQVKGQCYGTKGLATGSVAFAAGLNVMARSNGNIRPSTGTIGALSMTELRIQSVLGEATETVASSATGQVGVNLYG